MSLTQSHDVFVSVHEDGINDLIQAFYQSRRRYFVYATPIFTPATTAQITQIPTISFPGISGGIQFAIAFNQPKIDLYPDSGGSSTVLLPPSGKFTISAEVNLFVVCGLKARDINVTHGKPDDSATASSIESTTLTVHAQGAIITDGNNIAFQVDEIEIVDITPDSLESVMECIIRMILNASLANIRIPIPALSFDAFSLTLTDGPRIEDDQVKVWGVI